MKLYVVALLVVVVGCGPSAQEKKANSLECLTAKNQAAERKAKAGSLKVGIRFTHQTPIGCGLIPKPASS